MLVDGGCDSNCFPQALANRGKRLFGRLKDCRRIAIRHDRCAHTFISAICMAATVIF